MLENLWRKLRKSFVEYMFKENIIFVKFRRKLDLQVLAYFSQIYVAVFYRIFVIRTMNEAISFYISSCYSQVTKREIYR